MAYRHGLWAVGKVGGELPYGLLGVVIDCVAVFESFGVRQVAGGTTAEKDLRLIVWGAKWEENRGG